MSYSVILKSEFILPFLSSCDIPLSNFQQCVWLVCKNLKPYILWKIWSILKLSERCCTEEGSNHCQTLHKYPSSSHLTPILLPVPLIGQNSTETKQPGSSGSGVYSGWLHPADRDGWTSDTSEGEGWEKSLGRKQGITKRYALNWEVWSIQFSAPEVKKRQMLF